MSSNKHTTRPDIRANIPCYAPRMPAPPNCQSTDPSHRRHPCPPFPQGVHRHHVHAISRRLPLHHTGTMFPHRWPEWRALHTETARTALTAALELLADCYGIRHIRISAYNSRTNGIVERQHRTM